MLDKRRASINRKFNNLRLSSPDGNGPGQNQRIGHKTIGIRADQIADISRQLCRGVGTVDSQSIHNRPQKARPAPQQTSHGHERRGALDGHLQSKFGHHVGDQKARRDVGKEEDVDEGGGRVAGIGRFEGRRRRGDAEANPVALYWECRYELHRDETWRDGSYFIFQAHK